MVLEDISPQQGLACRQARPTAEPVAWYVRAVSAVLRPVVLPLARRAYRRAEARRGELFKRACECTSREELETLLGPPTYALTGSAYRLTGPDGSTHSPERVETYARDRVAVNLLFNADGTRETIAFVLWSPWDLAVGLPGELSPLNSARGSAAPDNHGECET